MPRKEELSIEERLARARELFLKKQAQKQQEIAELHTSRIYKLAKKSCIAFLWIAQLLLIDWALPYHEIPDTITNGCSAPNERYNRKHSSKEVNMAISSTTHKNLEILLFRGRLEPEINDSILLLKSYLLHEIKKTKDITNDQTYTVTNSTTYYLLPIIIMFSLLSALFLFIKNIEVKAFFYFVFFANIGSIIALIIYFIVAQTH